MPDAPSASQATAKAPQMPVSAPVTAKAQAEFLQLKKSLDSLASWELAPASWADLPMHFSEGGSEAQARLIAQALS